MGGLLFCYSNIPGIVGIHSIFQVYSQVLFHLSVSVFVFLFPLLRCLSVFYFSGSFCYYPPVV